MEVEFNFSNKNAMIPMQYWISHFYSEIDQWILFWLNLLFAWTEEDMIVCYRTLEICFDMMYLPPPFFTLMAWWQNVVSVVSNEFYSSWWRHQPPFLLKKSVCLSIPLWYIRYPKRFGRFVQMNEKVKKRTTNVCPFLSCPSAFFTTNLSPASSFARHAHNK